MPPAALLIAVLAAAGPKTAIVDVDAPDLMMGLGAQVTRALVHKTLVGERYGDANAWANVAAAPSAEAARALHGQGGATGNG